MSDEDVQEILIGEHGHLILQALCRGRVRRCDQSRCPPTNAYLIASKRSGIAEQLPKIFPGARVEPWRPVRKALTGKVAEAITYIQGRLEADPHGLITFQEVATATRWKNPRDFKKSVRRHPDFIFALDELGIEEFVRPGTKGGFRLITSEPDTR